MSNQTKSGVAERLSAAEQRARVSDDQLRSAAIAFGRAVREDAAGRGRVSRAPRARAVLMDAALDLYIAEGEARALEVASLDAEASA